MLTLDSPPTRGPRPGSSVHPRGRVVVAALLGLLSALLAIAHPLLPVRQDTLDLQWPTAARGTDPVTAPLVAVRPERLDARIPCVAIASLAERGSGTVVATTPPGVAGSSQVGLAVTVADEQIMVVTAGEVVAEAAVPPEIGPDCALTLTSDAERTSVMLGGRVLVSDTDDRRPEVVGVYSDLDDEADPTDGTSVTVTVDNRYDSSPTPLKLAVGAAAVAALLGSLLALHGLDRRFGRRVPRLRGRQQRRDGDRRTIGDALRDVVVIGTLGIWLVIGSVTADDGYIFTMVRTAPDTGYVANYYRWLGVPEAPFGWFYELYAQWVALGDAVAWLRLPSLAMGVISWLLLSRGLLPRLGRQVRQSGAAGWGAALVFLCFWLPYDSGLRPEPVVVIGTAVSYVLVERAMVVRRILPICIALIAAAFATAATPTGLFAAAPVLAAARPLLRLTRERARAHGWVSTLAPVLASGLVVLVAAFGDQTLATVLEATDVRTAIGPNVPWYNELARYVDLFALSQDGSLARRFPVLLLILCTGVCVAVILRKVGIPGAALGPSRRLIAVTLLGFAVLALTPTKWTHHFGAFAVTGGGMGALAALATSAAVLTSARNRLAFTGAVIAVAALAFTGPNAWMYVSNWGVPWHQMAPEVNGIVGYELLLGVAALFLAAAVVVHLRRPTRRPGPLPPVASGDGRLGTGVRGRTGRRALRFGTAPLVVVCGAMVLFQLGSMVRGIQNQTALGSYSVGGDVLARGGTGCGLSDRVQVETDPVAGLLPLATGRPGDEDPVFDGFDVDALPPTGGSSGDSGTGYGLQNGVGPAVGSYRAEGGTGTYRSAWFALPGTGTGDVVIGVAGRTSDATSVTLEFGAEGAGGGTRLVDEVSLGDGRGGEPTWRDLRTTLDGRAADVVRVVVSDRALAPDAWIAVTPPRVPQQIPMSDAVGDAPALVDWPAPFANPCIRPFSIDDGVAEVPRYRLYADAQLRQLGDIWSGAPTGGPLAWLELLGQEVQVPGTLDGEPDRDWGRLTRIDLHVPDAGAPDAVRGTAEHWGWYSAGPQGPAPPGVPGVGR